MAAYPPPPGQNFGPPQGQNFGPPPQGQNLGAPPPGAPPAPQLQLPPPPPPSMSPSGQRLCPPGMEYLINTSTVIVRQQVEMLEVLTGFETNNRYDVLDMVGNRIYIAAEITGAGERYFEGNLRSFRIYLFDNAGRPVLKFHRIQPAGFRSSCVDNMVSIFGIDDSHIGDVVQTRCRDPQFFVKDGGGNDRLVIDGPPGCCVAGPHVQFLVKDFSGNQIGAIHKQWAGTMVERFTDADVFGVQFQLDLDAHLKSIILGAVFLLDFMYFEQGGGHHHHHHNRGYGHGHHGYGHGGYDHGYGHHHPPPGAGISLDIY